MTGFPLVYIVILNWNGWQDTLACVDSCRHLSWPNFHILVIDNASSDGSEEILRRRLKDVEIIQSGANLGFAGGNNVGIRHALDRGAAYVWLLNNDATTAPAALTKLVDAMEGDAEIALAGSKIYLESDPCRLCFAGGMWQKGYLRWRMRGADQIDSGQFDNTEDVVSLSGCSLLIRASAIKDIGLMEESFFLYWEDTEWCARVIEKGHKVLFVPESHVWHKVSSSTGKDTLAQHYYSIRNGCFFLRQYDPFWVPVYVVYTLLFCFKSFVGGNARPIKAFTLGLSDFLRGKKGRMAVK